MNPREFLEKFYGQELGDGGHDIKEFPDSNQANMYRDGRQIATVVEDAPGNFRVRFISAGGVHGGN